MLSFLTLCSTIYYSLVILLERPFVANGHLSSTEEDIGSWGECTIAAEKIAHLLYAYRRSYSFRRIPYQICYTTYVASTILVRNVNTDSETSSSISHLAVCLKAFEEMKLAHPGSSRMLAIIRSLMGRLGVNVDDQFLENISTSRELKLFSHVNLGCLTFSALQSGMLPNSDFAASTMAAVQNRNINIDTIKQSFTQNPALTTLPVPNVGVDMTNPQQTPDLGVPPTLGTAPDVDYEVMDLSQQDPSNGWHMSLGDLDDDLLFGVLGSDWP